MPVGWRYWNLSRIDDFHDSFWIFAPLTSICVDRFLNKTNEYMCEVLRIDLPRDINTCVILQP